MAMLNNQRVNLPRCHGLALGRTAALDAARRRNLNDAQLTGRASGSQVRYGKSGEIWRKTCFLQGGTPQL